MDRLTGMEVFVRVAEARSFSKAARQLGMSNTTVTNHVKALEDHLGVRLLNRTTRRVRLTEVGRAYHERCLHLLSEVDETERSVGRLHSEPKGQLRVNAPISFGFLHVAPTITAFLERYPEIEVELIMTDRYVDVIEEGFDIAIRGRSVPRDSSLIGRKLLTETFAVCASPDYLRQRDRPEAPEDLAEHNCLTYVGSAEWQFEAGGRLDMVPVTGNFCANNGDALRTATLSGFGISLLPTFIVGNDLRTGSLERVLPDHRVPEAAFYAVYPHNRHLSAKVRALLDFLVERFAAEPFC